MRTWPRPNGASARLPERARRLSRCRNSSVRSTSAGRKTRTSSTWPNLCRGRPARAFRGWPASSRWSSSGRSSSGEPRGCITIPRWSSMRMARCSGHTGRCTFPTTPSTSRNTFYCTRGDLVFRCFDTRYARVAALVCWDQWYPEAARIAALGGAQVLFYPTAIGWHPSEKAQYGEAQHDAWRTIQRSHAIANGLYVAAVNRVGYEGPPEAGLEFWGGSFVADPFGQVLAEASHDREETLIVECDPRRIEEVRRNWPFLRDRRIDAYGPILKRVID